MDASLIYIAIAIATLAVIAVLFTVFFVKKKKVKMITPLTGIAFGFVLAGIMFGESRLIGYSLMGIGVSLAIIDAVRKARK